MYYVLIIHQTDYLEKKETDILKSVMTLEDLMYQVIKHLIHLLIMI